MLEISSGTVIRTLCLIVALINQVLSGFGKSPLPIEDETITTMVSAGITIATAVAAWWKNNSFTKAAIEADKLIRCRSVSDAGNAKGAYKDSNDTDNDNSVSDRTDSGGKRDNDDGGK